MLQHRATFRLVVNNDNAEQVKRRIKQALGSEPQVFCHEQGDDWRLEALSNIKEKRPDLYDPVYISCKMSVSSKGVEDTVECLQRKITKAAKECGPVFSCDPKFVEDPLAITSFVSTYEGNTATTRKIVRRCPAYVR